jgi:integrase
MLLDQLRDDYVATNTAIRSQETKRLLRIATDKFAEYLGHEAHAGELTDRNIAAFVQWRRSLGRAETTIERESGKLLTLARHAASLALLPAPRLRIPKSRVDSPVAFLRHEVRSLFRAAAAYDSSVCGVPGDVFMLAVLNLIWDTGERIGALYALDRADIDGRWVTFRHRKNGGQVLVRRVSRSTARSLEKLLEASTGSKPFAATHRSNLYHHLDRLLVMAGIPVSRRHKFHCLRRSHASWLHRLGGDAQESLGHATQEITRRHYFDVRITHGRHAADVLFSPLGWWGRLRAACGF